MPRLFLTLAFLICCAASASGQVLNPGNGHYYQLSESALVWQDAKVAAESMTFMGVQGHLATITSQQENDFMVNTFGTLLLDTWLGGFQLPNSSEPDGGWQWVTGEPWEFTHWGPGEPNNANGTEDKLHYIGNIPGNWNDIVDFAENRFWIEFDVSAVPEPGTLSLVALTAGVGGAYYWRRRNMMRNTLLT